MLSPWGAAAGTRSRRDRECLVMSGSSGATCGRPGPSVGGLAFLGGRQEPWEVTDLTLCEKVTWGLVEAWTAGVMAAEGSG